MAQLKQCESNDLVINTICFHIFQIKQYVSGNIRTVLNHYSSAMNNARWASTDEHNSANSEGKTSNKPNINPSKGHGMHVHSEAVEFSNNTGEEPEVRLPITSPSNPGE